MEAAETVAAGGGLVRSQVLDLLAQLVEKSLVEFDADDQRYRMLETVREYARFRLLESGEEERLRAQHLAFFVALANQAGRELYGPAQVEWLIRLDPELENLLAAHEWCNDADGGAESGMRLVSPLLRYWIHRGLLDLGYRLTTEALGRAGAREHGIAYCQALMAAGGISYHMGQPDLRERYSEEALAVARKTGERRIIADALWRLAACDGCQGGMAMRRRHAEEALALSRELGDTYLIGPSLNCLAQVTEATGDLDVVERLHKECLTLSRKSGDRESAANSLLNLAMLSMRRGSPQGTQERMLEALAIAQDTGSKRMQGLVLGASMELAAYLCDWSRAARLHGACAAHTEETGIAYQPEGPDETRPERVREALGSSAFTSAAEKGRQLGSNNALAEVRAWLEVALGVS